jgi:hypothetical protein
MGIRELELNDKFRNDKLLPNNGKMQQAVSEL